MTNEVSLHLSLDGQPGVVNGLRQVSNSVEGMGKSAKQAIADLAHIGGAFIVFQQAAGSVISATRALDEFTTSASRLSLVATSANQAAEAQSALFKIAQESRVSYTGLADTYAKMARAGNEMGVSQTRLLGVTNSISQAMTISGGSAESMKAALVQLSQAMASGVLRGEELNSIMEQAPRLAQAIAEGMGKSVGELRKLGEEGKLTATTVIKALEASAPKLTEEFSKMTPTISQAFQVLSDGATKAFYEFDKGSGASASLAKSVADLGKNMGDAGAAAREFGEKYGTAIKTVGEIAAIMAALAAVTKLTSAIAGLAAFVANPITITVSLAVIGTKGLDHLIHETESGLQLQLEQAEKRLAAGKTGLDANPNASAGTRSTMLAGIRSDEQAVDRLREKLTALRVEAEASSPKAKALASMRQSERDYEAGEKQAVEGQTNARKKAMEGYLKELRSEKQKQLDEENDKFSALKEVIGTSGKDYETALAAHQAKIAEIRKKGAGADGSKNDAAQIFAAEIKAAQDSAKTAVDIIQEKIKQQVLAEREGVEQILAAQNEGYVKQATLLKDRLAGTSDAGERARLKTQIVELGNDAALAAEKAQAGIVKIDEANLKAFQSYMKGIGDETASLLDKAKASEMENEQIGMSTEALAELTRKRYDEQIALKQRRLDAIANNEGMAAEKHLIEQQIDALTRLRDAEITKPKLREQAREWEKFSDDINRSLTDALYRSFESGESFGKSFVKSLQNTLKTTVLKFAVQAVTSTGGNVLNSAINAVAGTSDANNGSGTNYLGLASNANSIYNVANGNYLNTATGLYNDYVAGTTIGGYTAGYIGAGGSGITGAGIAYGASSAYSGLGLTAVGTEALGGGLTAAGGGLATTGSSTLGTMGAANGLSTSSTLGGSYLTATSAPVTIGATGGAGTAVAGAAPASSSTGIGAYAWPLAAVVGMFMSSEAWKAGIRWNGEYSPGKNLKQSGLHGAIHDGQYQSAEFFFGKDHADGQFFQTVTFAALSQQISKMVWGGVRKLTGISSLQGAFVENGEGDSFVGQAGHEWKQSGMAFKSGRSGTDWQNVSVDFQDSMSDMYKGIRNSLLLAGAAFDDFSLADKIKGFVTLVDVKNANNIQGVQEALANQIMQGLGSLMFPSIGAMQKTITKNGMAVAESWSEIFGRVMQEVAATGNVFDLLGHNIFDIFGTGNADQVLRLSDNFVQLFGNIEGMNQRVGAYYANFYSAQEKTDYAWKQMEQAFAGIQQVMPTTRQGFRDLVDAQIKLGPAGNDAFKALMDLQGAFAQLTPEISGLAKLTVAAAESMVKSAHALATVKASNTAFAQAQLNATITKADEAYAALERAVDAEKKKAQATADAAQEQVTDLRSIFDMLGNSIKSLYGSVNSVSNQSFSFIDDALATAQSSGYMPDATDLSNALSDAQNVLSQRVYASEVDQQRDRLVLAGKLSQLKEIGGDQLDSAKQSLETAKAELDRLDNVLLTAKTQLDELKGINVSVLSVTAALADLALIMQQAASEKEQVTAIKKMTDPNSIAITAAYQSALGRSPEQAGLDYWAKLAAEKGVGFAVNGINTSAEAQVSALYSAVLGRAPDAGGLAHWMDKLNNGMSYEAAKAAMQTSDEYVASHPAYASAASAPAATTESSISNLYATLLGRTADDGGLANWASQVTGAGWSIDQVAEAIKASDEYKNSHATGLEYVPFNGYKATLHQGEAVVDAQSVSAIRRYFNVTPTNGGGNEQLITFINKLMLEVQELKTLQSENNRYARRTANATNGNPDVPVLVKVV